MRGWRFFMDLNKADSSTRETVIQALDDALTSSRTKADMIEHLHEIKETYNLRTDDVRELLAQVIAGTGADAKSGAGYPHTGPRARVIFNTELDPVLEMLDKRDHALADAMVKNVLTGKAIPKIGFDSAGLSRDELLTHFSEPLDPVAAEGLTDLIVGALQVYEASL